MSKAATPLINGKLLVFLAGPITPKELAHSELWHLHLSCTSSTSNAWTNPKREGVVFVPQKETWRTLGN
jgi:hypothetical protein